MKRRKCSVCGALGHNIISCAKQKEIEKTNREKVKEFEREEIKPDIRVLIEDMPFNLGSIFKYMWRVYHNEQSVENLKKARFHIERELSRLGVQ